MNEALSGGAVIVPAYLRDEHDVSVLADLLSGLPGIVDRRVVVAQPIWPAPAVPTRHHGNALLAPIDGAVLRV